MKILLCISASFFLAAPAFSQSGGTFNITSSTIAAGGGDVTGTGFSVTGTKGQPVAGTVSTGPGFSVESGFWHNTYASPTAAGVAVGGRVVSPDGRGLRGVMIELSDGAGGTTSAPADGRGFFHFDNVEVGKTYILQAVSRRFRFAPVVITLNDELTSLRIIAER
jgi:hypothetical protein